MKHKPLYLFFFFLVLIPYISFSATITGKVISVADGDTITILTQQHEQIKIRLSAVDIEPEKIKIPLAKWKKIEKTIRNSLKSLSEESEMSEYIERIKGKLPELKSLTTFDKILHCCKTLDVKANDLWEKDGLEVGLNKALKMRNQLFHRTSCDNPYFLYANFVRIQVLTERLILKHLKWPDEKIWRWYDQKIRRCKMD